MRLLVIEDEERLASYLRRGLEREGYAVDIALDGEAGLWQATTARYDAIILDILLPKLNGFLVCSELRRRQVWSPVLMLTAKDGELDEAEALDTGADDFLSKPFSFVVLLARLRALVRRGTPERPSVLEAGLLHLDPAKHQFTNAGREVNLTRIEFEIMRMLMLAAGRIVSKEDMLESCWDWAFDGGHNTVEVHISNLRRKLDPGTLETVRGAGYRLKLDGL